MINKELYMKKLAAFEDEITEDFGGKAIDPNWMPIHMKTTSRYSSSASPSWTRDSQILKKHKIYWDTNDYGDSNDSYWINMDAKDAFRDAGENSGIARVHYTTFENTPVGWFRRSNVSRIAQQ